MSTARSEEARLLFSFIRPEDAKAWAAINDGVMGGVSEGEMRPTDQGSALFAGEISLANNGGFSSVHSRTGAYDLSGFGGIALRCRGYGRRYKFSVRVDPGLDRVMYQAGFDPVSDEWSEHFLPFDSFIPTHHGRRVDSAGPLDPGRILAMGLLIADGQAGPFRLEIEWIKARR